MTAPTEHACDAAAAAPAAPAAHDTSSPASRRLLSKAQVAERLGCSERSLERLVKQGRFPAPRRYGRAVVWFESVVEHVLGLAEQEQLQWQPGASAANATTVSTTAAQEPTAPSMIPAAHELEGEEKPPRQKPRKPRATRNTADAPERPCQRRSKSDPLCRVVAEVNLTHPGPMDRAAGPRRA